MILEINRDEEYKDKTKLGYLIADKKIYGTSLTGKAMGEERIWRENKVI